MFQNDFRAFPKSSLKEGTLPKGQMYYSREIDGKLMFVMESDSDMRYPFASAFSDEDWVIMRFTGMLDKCGKRMYEDDLVLINTLGINYQSENIRGVIRFIDGCFTVTFATVWDVAVGAYRKNLYVKCFVANQAIAVLGNVHQIVSMDR